MGKGASNKTTKISPSPQPQIRGLGGRGLGVVWVMGQLFLKVRQFDFT